MARTWTIFRTAIRWILVLLSLGLGLMVITRAWVINSEPYAVAKHFLLSNLCLRREVGVVKGVKLAYFERYEIRGGAIKGEATFTIRAHGERSNATVVLTLVKDLGEWSVASAIAENQEQKDLPADLARCHP